MKALLILLALFGSSVFANTGVPTCTTTVDIDEENLTGTATCVVKLKSTSGRSAEGILGQSGVAELEEAFSEKCIAEGKSLVSTSTSYDILTPGVFDNQDGTITWFGTVNGKAECE